MKFAAILVALLVTCPLAAEPLEDAIDTLAREISSSAKEMKKRKIAVLPFDEAEGKKSVLSTYVPETLVTNLFRLGRYEIVERQMLDKVIAEVKKQYTGVFDEKTAAQVGRLLGVEAIISGTITDFPEYVGINCRIIDTTTATVFGASNTTIAKDANLRGLVKEVLPPGTKPTIATEDRPTFSNAYFRVEVESAERRADQITLSILVHARHSEPRTFWMTGIYLLDENGERWTCRFADGSTGESLEIHPRTRRKLSILCRSGENMSGTSFTLLTEHGDVKSIEGIVPVTTKKK